MSSYIDVFQVQGVQILTVSLPQYGRPLVTRDGTCQHNTLADCHRRNADFLVIWKVKQENLCGQDRKTTTQRFILSFS